MQRRNVLKLIAGGAAACAMERQVIFAVRDPVGLAMGITFLLLSSAVALRADEIEIPEAIRQQAAKTGLEIREARVRNVDGSLFLKIYNASGIEHSIRIEIERSDSRGVVRDSFKAATKIAPTATWSVKQTVHGIKVWTVTALIVEPDTAER